jgi:xanthine dehydrogenase YagR molybdenum-binding subunit
VGEFVPEGASQDALNKLREAKIALSSEGKVNRWGYGAHFVEVRIHNSTGEIRIERITSAFSAGQIENRLTALSQLKGGMIWGIGSVLLEATELDKVRGRYVNDNLSDYLVPVAADLGSVEAILLDQQSDPFHLTGLGELGIIGVNAAVANAVYNATGKRCRNLPIRLDDML